MRFALDTDGNRVCVENADKKNKYVCPCCDEELTVRQGRLIGWCFAHKSGSLCDVDNDMSEWHIRMQGYFSQGYQEVVVDKKHRADVLKDGVVIEFQHSPISSDDFEDRNNYYLSKGYRVCWVFDTSGWIDGYDLDSGKLIPLYDWDSNLYRFKHPLKVLASCYGRDDFRGKKVSICFCDEDDFVFRVNWAGEDWHVVAFNDSTCALGLGDNLDLNKLFYDNWDWKKHFLSEGKVYRQVYRTIKGHHREDYLCPDTGTWARDCSNCSCCDLIHQDKDGRGSKIYCTYNGKRVISDDINPPVLMLGHLDGWYA